MTAIETGNFSRAHRAKSGEKIVRCVCRPDCFGNCAHDVTVREGRVVQTQPAPFPDQHFNRMCLRGAANLQRIYDPERILYPMKRVGPRGSGMWERITWDEATTLITDNWKETQAKYGKQALAFGGGSGNFAGIHGGLFGLMSRLENVLESTTFNHSVDAAVQFGEAEVAGPLFMLPTNNAYDLMNAKTIVILGFNATESQIHYWHFVQDARRAGAKVICIDPVFTNTAANSDEYIPIRPGGDVALLLSLTYCALRDGKEDKEFMRDKTVAPYLVREDDGMFLRMSDLGHEGDSRAVVLDQDGNHGPAGEVEDPLVEGRHDVQGFKVTNALQILREHLEDYTPDKVSGITDIPAARIEQLYEQMISGPTTIRSGYGGQALNNGVMVGKGLMTWASVTGMIGRPGADVGTQWEYYRGTNFGFAVPNGKMATFIETMIIQELFETGKFRGEEHRIKSMYFYQGNWVGNSVNQNGFKEQVIDQLDFIATADLVWTDTARLSDIVLPAAHYYEHSDLVLGLGTHPYLQYSEKAIEPLGEAKPDGEIARLLAQKMGVGEFFDKSDDDYMSEMITSEYSDLYQVTLERLKKEGAISVLPDHGLNFDGEQNFPSSDGRLQFYMESPKTRFDYGQKLPIERERLARFFPPTEAWPGTQAQLKYPLTLLSARPRYRVHGIWFGQRWMRELDPEPTLKIHSSDAEARGIEDGDYVEAYNDRGHVVAKAIVTEGIKPGTLTYPKGWQRHQHIAGSFSEVNSDEHDPIGVNSSFFDATVEVRKWEENK